MYYYLIKTIITLILISSVSNIKWLQQLSVEICIYLLFKWITNYRKCTLSYIECKIRKVKKENGYIYNFLEPIFDINKYKYKYLIYLIISSVCLINILLFINHHHEPECLFLDL